MLKATRSRWLVTTPGEPTQLINILREKVRRNGASLHAAYISQHEAHLALQIGEQPLNAVIGGFQHAYARWFNRTHQEHGPLFKMHHRELLFQHQTWLVRVVHYIHWMRRLRAPSEGTGDLWWSSDAAYRADKRLDGLTTNLVLNMLARGARRDAQIDAYRRVFDGPPAQEHVRLIVNGSPDDPRILGDPEFVREVWRRSGLAPVRLRRMPPSPQAIEAEVSRVVDGFRELCDRCVSGSRPKAWRELVTMDGVRSRSRQRPLPMVRSLCVSSLVAGKIASPSEAAAFFDGDRRPMSAARRRFYEQRFAEAFGISAGVLFKPRLESSLANRIGAAGAGSAAPGRGAASSSADLLRRFMAGAGSGAASGSGRAKTPQAPWH
jgi:hypothetical protein